MITFGELINKYERVTVDFITKEILTDQGLASEYFNLGKGKAVNPGHAAFV